MLIPWSFIILHKFFEFKGKYYNLSTDYTNYLIVIYFRCCDALANNISYFYPSSSSIEYVSAPALSKIRY